MRGQRPLTELPGGPNATTALSTASRSCATEKRSSSQSCYTSTEISSANTSTLLVRQNTPGQTVLYRGGYSLSKHNIFDKFGNVVGDKFGELQKRRPGDLNSTKNAVYMAVDLCVAEKYALWV